MTKAEVYTRNALSLISAGFGLLALFIIGPTAWSSFSQHKANVDRMFAPNPAVEAAIDAKLAAEYCPLFFANGGDPANPYRFLGWCLNHPEYRKHEMGGRR